MNQVSKEQEPRFVMDHMVIRLGKYLRALGYDAIWKPGIRTHELIAVANRDSRYFVTRNQRITKEYPLPVRLITVLSDDPVQQLRELLSKVPLDVRSRAFTRCIRCNEALVPITDTEKIRERIHPNVLKRYARFFTCPHCGTVFWRGSHVRNTCRKLGVDDVSDLSASHAGPQQSDRHNIGQNSGQTTEAS